jgi:hypothetical protein
MHSNSESDDPELFHPSCKENLAGLSSEAQASFIDLKDLTDGKPGAHLRHLEEAEYIVMTKTFVRNTPQTSIEATPMGGRAFREDVAMLKASVRRTIWVLRKRKNMDSLNVCIKGRIDSWDHLEARSTILCSIRHHHASLRLLHTHP